MTVPFEPTPEQRAILQHPLAPLRVAAGAGTGKTTTLAHRVASMVDRHDVTPDRVLGITFTNKAAHELAERIRDVLGARLDPGDAVEVLTYHGFAAAILREHGLRVGVERTASIITPTFGRQLLLDAVTSTGFRHVDVTARRKVIGDLTKLAADLGDNLLTPAALRLPEPDEGADPDEDDVAVRRAEYGAALWRYEALKSDLDVLDYSDLIRLAHKLVVENPDVAAAVRSQYDLVLLDEYQDTNPAQRELLQAIFGNGFPVTAVGDRDQTIYEWRGASLENFARFPEHFPTATGAEATTRGLTINRRSGPEILTVANRVREEIRGERADPLRPLDDAPAASVAASWHRTSRQEAEAVAAEVRRLHQDGFSYRDMAVLFRKNKDIALVRDALEDHGIPIQVANLGGLLTIPEVVEVHAWLRILDNPEDSAAMARVLMGSRHRLGMVAMRHLADWVRTQDRAVDPDEEMAPRHTLIEAIEHVDEISRAANGQGLDDPARAGIEAFLDRFRLLLTAAQGTSLVELVQMILNETDAWRDVEAMPPTAQLSARLNLYRFLDLAESWSPLEGRPSLGAFVAYLDLMQEEDIEELDTARISDDDAVTLLTVHRAKGLEWDVVFVPACYRNNFPSQSRLLEDPFAQPGILPHELRLDRDQLPAIDPDMTADERRDLLRDRHNDQEWRLAYVAVTRARRVLHLSGAAWTGSPVPNKRATKPSPLLDLVANMEETELPTWFEDPGERPKHLRFETLDASPDPLFPDGWDAALRAMIDDPELPAAMATERGLRSAYDDRVSEFQDMLFSLPEPIETERAPEPLRTSVTSLVTYATCPRRYFWSDVDRLPRRASPAARRGVELHRRIEMHHRGAIPFDDLDDDLYDVVPAEREGTAATGTAFASFMASRFAALSPAFIEAPFDLALRDGARVRGRIDAIYTHTEDHWEVVDFKSGRPSSNPATNVQLEAYAIATFDAGFAHRSPSTLDVTFAYFGDGLEEDRQRVTTEWMKKARTHLDEMIVAITNEQFAPQPSPACRSCDFVQFCEAGTAWLSDHG